VKNKKNCLLMLKKEKDPIETNEWVTNEFMLKTTSCYSIPVKITFDDTMFYLQPFRDFKFRKIFLHDIRYIGWDSGENPTLHGFLFQFTAGNAKKTLKFIHFFTYMG
jgi:hypothetical protein